jgi:lipopolysaccharide export LptBFGC system permease protein LptF
MSRNSGGGGAGLLIFMAIVLGITYYGEMFATKFASEFGSMIAALAPIWVPICIGALGLVLFRYYWSRW